MVRSTSRAVASSKDHPCASASPASPALLARRASPRAGNAPTLRGKLVLLRIGSRGRSTSLEVERPIWCFALVRDCWSFGIPEVSPERRCRFSRSVGTSGTVGGGVELGYARVSTVKQDLDRQIDALEQTGIPRERIYVDRKSGATTGRPGLREVIAYAREGDVDRKSTRLNSSH